MKVQIQTKVIIQRITYDSQNQKQLNIYKYSESTHSSEKIFVHITLRTLGF